MRKFIVVCTVVLFTFLGSSSIYAQASGESPYIYRIVAEECQHEPTTRTLTGFRLRDISGIITALHGVVDCTKIEAKGLNTPDINGLAIKLVDVRYDIAVLNPLSGDILSAKEGLPYGNVTPEEDTISISGHPYGITAQLRSTDLHLHEPQMVQLQSLLSSEVFSLLSHRKSPDPTIDVLSIEGDLLPGHSGAPIFNNKGEVIGIGNGGLYRSSITWGIIWAKVRPTLVKDNNLETLKGFTPGSLFEFPQSFNSTPPEEWLPLEITITNDGKSEEINQVILGNSDYTYELVTQRQWPVSSNVIVKRNENVIATGRIGDKWMDRKSDIKLQLKLSYCEVFLCLRSAELSTNGIVFVDKDTQYPIKRATVIITWVDAEGVEGTSKAYTTGDEGEIVLPKIPENATSVKVQVRQNPCYDWQRNLLIDVLRSPIEVLSNCSPVSTLTATPTATETPMPITPTEISNPSFTPTGKPTFTGTSSPTNTLVPPILTSTDTPLPATKTPIALTPTPTFTVTSTPTDTPNPPTLTSTPSSTSTMIPTSTVIVTFTSTNTPTNTSSPTETSELHFDVVVIVGGLNVRTGPGTGYPRIGGVNQGNTLKVIEQAYNCDWLKVITPNGREGWISGRSSFVTRNLPCERIPVGVIPPTPTFYATPTGIITPTTPVITTFTPTPSTPTLTLTPIPPSKATDTPVVVTETATSVPDTPTIAPVTPVPTIAPVAPGPTIVP